MTTQELITFYKGRLLALRTIIETIESGQDKNVYGLERMVTKRKCYTMFIHHLELIDKTTNQ